MGTGTTLADGSITFIRSGELLPAILNYRRDPQDPYRWIPDFPECKHREKQVGVRPCGALSVCWFCKLKSQIVTVPNCEDCDVEPKI